jgi:HSP20 family protein
MILSSWPSHARGLHLPLVPPHFALNAHSNPGGRLTVHATESGWQLVANAPGLDVGDVKIEATAQHLTVEVQRSEAAPEGFTRIHQERELVAFTERFSFRVPINVDAVEASVRQGVLTIEVPRAQPDAARIIPVSH